MRKFSFLKIGITGGIGCGKSALSQRLRKATIPIIPADLVARQLINRDREIRSKLMQFFGEQIYQRDGKLNRKRMANIIFNDRSARVKIDQLVHPKIIEYEHCLLDRIRKAGKTKIAGVEAALIFEAGSDKYFDVIIVVAASEETIFRRLSARDGLKEQQIMTRLQSQLPLAEKISRADYVIQNNGSLTELDDEAAKLVSWLHAKID